jgi:DNA-binding NarL/FixJ family response regulator
MAFIDRMHSSSDATERVKVFLVDDNELMLTRAAMVLAPSCTLVGTAKDGASALQKIPTSRPDVVVVDISMPGMTGLELAHQLRRSGSNAAIVFLTVHDQDDFVLAARAAGALGYVLKTRLASDLLLAVKEAHEGRPFVSPRSLPRHARYNSA